MISKLERKKRRQKRNSYTIKKCNRGELLRLSVYKSNHHIYCQIIDDKKQCTIVAASSCEIENCPGYNMQGAKQVGQLINKKATALGIRETIFDKGAFKYHGRIKELAEASCLVKNGGKNNV